MSQFFAGMWIEICKIAYTRGNPFFCNPEPPEPRGFTQVLVEQSLNSVVESILKVVRPGRASCIRVGTLVIPVVVHFSSSFGDARSFNFLKVNGFGVGWAIVFKMNAVFLHAKPHLGYHSPDTREWDF